MGKRIASGTLIAAAVLTAAACSSAPQATSASNNAATTTAPASPAAHASVAQPETAAAASAAARQYLGLYSAGQFAAAYGLFAPSARRAVSESTWVAVHQGCPPQASGLTYQVKDATVTGSTAVVTVTLAGAASSLASESEALTYSGGRWGFVPNDLSMYEHGSVKADLAAAKAAGYCTGS
jgi:flagellar capping protein FliD